MKRMDRARRQSLKAHSSMSHGGRHLVPHPALQDSAGFLLRHAAPLLEEEGNTRADALIPDVGNP